MDSMSRSAFLGCERSERSNLSASRQSGTRITFCFLPELDAQSQQANSTFVETSNLRFVWVPSDSSSAQRVLESKVTVQRSPPNAHTRFSTFSGPLKTKDTEPFTHHAHQVNKFTSLADTIQNLWTHLAKEQAYRFLTGPPVLESHKPGHSFCSIGLAGRQIGDGEKLNGSLSETTLLTCKHSESSTDASQKHALHDDTEERSKEVPENLVYGTVKHLSAGAISAIVSRSFVAPLERLKLEYMIRGAQQNVFQIMQLIVANEGLKGFWRGNTINLLRTAPFKSINFFCFDVYRKKLLEITGRKEASNLERLVAGAAAGISATLLCFPMDTIRTRIVAPGGESLGGIIGCFRHMVQTEGFFSLYNGLLPAVISMAPSGAVFYGVYDILKTSYLHSPEGQEDLRRRIEMERQRRGLTTKVERQSVTNEGTEALKEEAGNLGQLEMGPMRTLLYGALAGICAETATYPFEVVRRQLQMQNAASKMSALATCQGLLQRGGIGALYSGLLPSSLQVLPSAAISYFVYECMKVMLKVS